MLLQTETTGYGTTQIQALRDTHFENLDGSGGVTLRLETGVGFPGAYVGNVSVYSPVDQIE